MLSLTPSLKSQLRVARAVSQGTVQFYWELGKELIEKQKAFKWGEQFLTQFPMICV